jgi:hypothetical protein
MLPRVGGAPLTPARRADLLALGAEERYRYAVSQAVAAEQLWGLRDEEGWATVGDESGAVFLPLWPHAALATLCATDAWAAYRPEAIPLVELLAAWLPSLAEEGWGIAVFATPAMAGIHVASDELRGDLERAIRGA